MKIKRLICLLCALVLALTAVGCGSPNQADTDAVMAALEKFASCKSFTIVQTTECLETMRADGEEMVFNSRNELLLSLVTEPELQLMTVTSTTVEGEGDVFEQSKLSYIVPENGGYAEYSTDGNEWYKYSAEDSSALSGINASSITATFFADRLSYRKAGEEKLDSGKALRYEGILSGDDLIGMLGSYGYLNNVAAMSANQQTKIMENIQKDLKGVTVSVWLDEATGYPVRFEINMGKILKDLEESISKSLGNKASDSQYTISDCIISMTVSDFDAVEKIDLPAAAAAAKPYEVTE